MSQRDRDIAGNRYGRLVAVRKVNETGKARWLCRCDCGTERIVWLSNLLKKSRSCGCLQRELAAQARRDNPKHGQYKTSTYSSWQHMHVRCKSRDAKTWKYYGGRGIAVHLRWASFEAFFADMGPKPSPAHSIDRINNDRGYEPGNCRWATKKEQVANRRITKVKAA